LKIIAAYNIKGGVGKTSTAVNLAYLAASSGLPTLLWDLDPQAASSYYFRIKPKIKDGGKKLVSGKQQFDSVIKGTDFDNLDLLPADFSYRNLDLDLDAKKNSTQRLKRLLQPLAEEYDTVFLDCPPNITLLSEAVFAASDILLSPIIPTPLSLRTLGQLKTFIHGKKLKKLQLLAFFSMVDLRKKMHREIIATLPQTQPELLKTVIPYASDIERMGLERKPVGAFSRGRSKKAYQDLWQEIIALR